MVRFLPNININEITTGSERKVAKVLADQLPNESIIYHSYPWLKSERNKKNGKISLIEGETDFVVVVPGLGFLVIEVKGGSITYDSDKLTWFSKSFSGNIYEIKDPFRQASESMHQLAQQVIRNGFVGSTAIPFAHGYAVIFPDCTYQGALPPGAESSVLITAEDLPFIGKRVLDLLHKWWRSSNPPNFRKGDLQRIQKGLSPSFQLLPVLFRKIEDQEIHLVRLTKEQIRVLDFLKKHNRSVIEGVAGSGKTLLARAQAQRFADKGHRTLLVCYNKTLSEWLTGTLPDEYRDKISVMNFHRLCSHFCKSAGVAFSKSLKFDNNFWRNKAPERLMEATENCAERFDAIVVDEGQDFFPEWWTALEMVQANEEGPFYIFYDPAQNLYVGDEFLIPGFGAPMTLPTNCRNTKCIAETCSKIRGIDILVRDDAPQGDETITHLAETLEKQIRICRETIVHWLGSGKLKPSQIAIQSPNTLNNSSLSSVSQIGTSPLTEKLEEWQSDQGILFSTIRSFKGLEADAVIIINVPPTDSIPHFSQADFYVATSRAKHLLVVLTNAEGIV